MNDPIDERVKRWATGKCVRPEHLDELAGRIHTEIVRERVHAATRGTRRLWVGFAWAAAGALAMLMAVCFWPLHGGGNSGPREPAAGSLSGPSSIPPERLAAAAQLVDAMDRLFADNWRWVAESNGDMNMGIDRLQGGMDASTRPMLVRISLTAREQGSATWKQLWYSDVVLRSEDAVEITPNRTTGNRLTFWALPVSDGKVEVDVRLSLTNPQRVLSSESLLVQDGAYTEILSFREGTTEYKVHQTVNVLTEKPKGSV